MLEIQIGTDTVETLLKFFQNLKEKVPHDLLMLFLCMCPKKMKLIL